MKRWKKMTIGLGLLSAFVLASHRAYDEKGDVFPFNILKDRPFSWIAKPTAKLTGASGFGPDHISICVPKGKEHLMKNRTVLNKLNSLVNRRALPDSCYDCNPKNDVHNKITNGAHVFVYPSDQQLNNHLKNPRDYPAPFFDVIHYRNTTLFSGLACGKTAFHTRGEDKYTEFRGYAQTNGPPIFKKQ